MVTGYLGAGKTTLINRLLAENHGVGFAVVENEFGAESIDGKLLRGLDASHLFELKDGCICCTITDEYEQVLIELATDYHTIEHLLIETTGIADPGEVIRPFLHNQEILDLYEFYGTIGVADASRFEFLSHQPIAIRQLAAASLIVIAKSEEYTPQQSDALCEKLQTVNPFAQIIKFKELDGREIIKNHWKSLSRKQFLPEIKLSGSKHPNLTSRTFYFSVPMPRVKFEDWLSYQLDINRNFVHRTKGILYFKDEPFEYYLQGVGASYEIVEGSITRLAGKGVVVIVGDLDSAEITEFEFDFDTE